MQIHCQFQEAAPVAAVSIKPETPDPNIWAAMPMDGWVSYSLRRYLYTGNGCNFEIVLTHAHGGIEGLYNCSACAAMNCWFTPDWVNVRDLKPL